MQYLEWFARGLQSRVLQPLTHRLLRLAKYIVRHPFKSIWFVIKAYMATLLFIILTLLFVGAVSAQENGSIYEIAANGVLAATTASCETDYTPAELIAQHNSSNNLPRTEASWYQDARTLVRNQGMILTNNGQSCAIAYSYRSSGGNVNSDGTKVQTYNNVVDTIINGTLLEVPTCLNLGTNADGSLRYPDHNHLGNNADGIPYCFTAQDLEDVDSCDLNNPDVLGSSDSPETVCLTKDDGSKCAMVKYSANGQYAYAQNLEPSSCYEGAFAINPYEEPPVNPPSGDGCQSLGGGVDFCPTDPTNVCHPITGECPTGCGSFGIGGDTVFGCLKDSNSTCDPTQEVCSTPDTPDTPDDVIVDPILSTDDPRFQTAEGTNTILTGTNQRLTTIGSNIQETTQAVRTVGTGIGQATQGIEEIKEELSTTKVVGFPDAGELHTANDYETRNYGTVMQAAVERMQQAELSKAVNEFFEISLTGSCPIYTANVPYLNSTITIDQFCGSVMNQVWPIIRVIILLVFSILAFRVAVL